MTTIELEALMHSLNLFNLEQNHAEICAEIAKRKLSPYETLEFIARGEQRGRLERGCARRIQAKEAAELKKAKVKGAS